MEAVILNIAEFVKVYWPFLALLVPLLVGLVGLVLQGRLSGEAQRVVGAVYRAAINAAHEFEAQGLAWLVSAEGIAFRKELAERAYDALPVRVGWFPMGVLKMFISREKFAALVEKAFAEMVELADKLEDYLPDTI